jgi:hypothetical protein
VALRLRELARLLAEARLARAQAALERAGVRPEQIQVAPPRWDPDPRRHLGAVTLVLGVWGPDRDPKEVETDPAAGRGRLARRAHAEVIGYCVVDRCAARSFARYRFPSSA